MPIDVLGKEVKVGDIVEIPCKVMGISQSGNTYLLDLKPKYQELDSVANISNLKVRQVTKDE